MAEKGEREIELVEKYIVRQKNIKINKIKINKIKIHKIIETKEVAESHDETRPGGI